jgi:hypothetical protein
MPAAAIAGFVLVSLAMADFLIGGVFPASFLEGRGLSLSIGVLLLIYSTRLLRLLIAERRPEQVPRHAPGAVAEWGAVFILVSGGLFWAVGSYEIGVGIGRAQLFEASLRSFSDVAVYSDKSLSLQAPGVQEVTCQHPDAAYRFRYDGLKLVQQAGNQYLFLPSEWTHTRTARRYYCCAADHCDWSSARRARYGLPPVDVLRGFQPFRRAGTQARSVKVTFSRCTRKPNRFFAAAGSGEGARMVSGRSRRNRAGAMVAKSRQ